MKISTDIQRIIGQVEAGEFDDILCGLENSELGILVPAQALDGMVVPIPPGYGQSESNLAISITNESVEGSTRVGWFGNAERLSCGNHCHSHCTASHNHLYLRGGDSSDDGAYYESHSRRQQQRLDCYNHCLHSHLYLKDGDSSGDRAHCESHCRGMHNLGASAIDFSGSDCFSHCVGHNHVETRSVSDTDPLANAMELHPIAVEARVKSMCVSGSLRLNELATRGVGVALIHGHSRRYEFTALPEGMVALIEDGRTHFRYRSEVLGRPGFVPNIWRFEGGVRQPVGGFA